MEPLLAVGTSEVLGEDSPCTGRVLLFEVRRPEGAGADSDEWQATRRYSRLTHALPTAAGSPLLVLVCSGVCRNIVMLHRRQVAACLPLLQVVKGLVHHWGPSDVCPPLL